MGSAREVAWKGTHQAHIGESCMPDVGWKGVGCWVEGCWVVGAGIACKCVGVSGRCHGVL